MSKINDGGPAFPLTVKSADTSGRFFPGLSLRDYFAANALGMGFDWVNLHETGGYDEAAQVAYEIADAMLAAREVPTDNK